MYSPTITMWTVSYLYMYLSIPFNCNRSLRTLIGLLFRFTVYTCKDAVPSSARLGFVSQKTLDSDPRSSSMHTIIVPARLGELVHPHALRRGRRLGLRPTTTVYSIFDEIVQPLSEPNASAILGDTRRVGVTSISSLRAQRSPQAASIPTRACCITH
jgi:hypothetical protein